MLDAAEQKKQNMAVGRYMGLELEKTQQKRHDAKNIGKEYTWRWPWSWCGSVECILPWYPAEGSHKGTEHKSFI